MSPHPFSDLACPTCGCALDWATLFAAEEDRRAMARLAAASIPLGARVLQYIALHAPAKQRMTTAKKIKVLLQLLPDLERRAITYKGREWAIPLGLWAEALEQVLAQRDSGRLELPLKGHGYLYAVLAGMADKAPAVAPATGAVPPGERLHTAHGTPDPALADIAERERRAAPMPAHIRQQIAALRSTTKKGDTP